MIRRINTAVFILFLIALSLYVVVMNPQQAGLNLGADIELKTWAGVLYIGIFVAGFLVAAIFALFFGVKSHFRERKLQGKERQREAFYRGVVNARSSLAGEEWGKAREQWEQMVRKDPTDIIARVELSRSLEGNGEYLDALKILDGARAAEPYNTEVLFRAAELNRLLGNKTAAIDNLALILFHAPNRRAALLARDLSEELERYDDALEYNSRIEATGGASDETTQASVRLRFKKLSKETAGDRNALYSEMKSFVKKNSDYAPALSLLASLEAESGRIEDAAQLYIRAARAGRDPSRWHEASRLWIKNRMPERAIAAARSAANEAKGPFRLDAELHLIRLYVDLSMYEKARQALDEFPAVARAQGVPITEDVSQTLTALRGICLVQSGDHKGAADLWRSTISTDDSKIRSSLPPLGADGPSPSLSTP